jgi:hypothetical protein
MKNLFFQKITSSLILLIAILFFGIFSFWPPASSFITSTVLFIDEGQNFFLSQNGPLNVITSYKSPNNHVLFTLIQSFLPDSLLYSNPLLLRINNFLFVILTLFILCYILNKFAKFSLLLSACLAVGLLTVSPVHFKWLLFARGYVLGMLLIIGGCLLLVKEKNMILAALFFALSFWTIPTYGYILPGILTARFLRYFHDEKLTENIARTVLLGALVIGITLIFYAPIIKGVIHASRLAWLQRMAPQDFGIFLSKWATGFGQPASSKILAPVIIVLMFFFSMHILYKKSVEYYWAALLAGATASYFIVIFMLNILDISKPPFARNGMFTYTFVWGAVLLSSGQINKHLRNIVVMIFMGYVLMNIKTHYINPISQIVTKGVPYTLFDHIRDIGPDKINSVTSGPGIYPVIKLLLLEHNHLTESETPIRKIGWGKKRQAKRIFKGECNVTIANKQHQSPKDLQDWRAWRNKALIKTKDNQEILICY